MSRAVVDAHGVVTAVVAATLSPDYFQTLMTNMGHAPDMRVGLIHDTGRIYVAVPFDERLKEMNFLQPGSFTRRHLERGQPESVYEGETTLQGGGARLVAVKSASLQALGARHGFFAVASRSMDVLLLDWRHDNALMAGAVLIMVVLSTVSLYLYQRWVGRLAGKAQRTEAALKASHARYEQLANTLPCVLFDCE